MRISPGLLIAQEGDILTGSLAVKVSKPVRMSPFSTIQKLVVVGVQTYFSDQLLPREIPQANQIISRYQALS